MKVEKMKREKTGGRIKGTPNNTTKEIKEFIQVFLENQFDKLEDIFNELEPKEKINALTKLLAYVVPKQAQIDMTAIHKTEIKHDLSKLSDAELHNLLAITEKTNPN